MGQKFCNLLKINDVETLLSNGTANAFPHFIDRPYFIDCFYLQMLF
jgi:hypothetical protein